MDTYAIVDGNKNVVNVVLWDGGPGWAPPEGMTAVQVTAETGPAYPEGSWNGTAFVAPTNVQVLTGI